MPIGTALKHHRTARGLTQVALASASGVSLRQIRRYENDEQEPPLDAAVRIADTLDVSLDALAGRQPSLSADAILSRFDEVAAIPVEPREAAWR